MSAEEQPEKPSEEKSDSAVEEAGGLDSTVERISQVLEEALTKPSEEKSDSAVEEAVGLDSTVERIEDLRTPASCNASIEPIHRHEIDEMQQLGGGGYDGVMAPEASQPLNEVVPANELAEPNSMSISEGTEEIQQSGVSEDVMLPEASEPLIEVVTERLENLCAPAGNELAEPNSMSVLEGTEEIQQSRVSEDVMRPEVISEKNEAQTEEALDQMEIGNVPPNPEISKKRRSVILDELLTKAPEEVADYVMESAKDLSTIEGGDKLMALATAFNEAEAGEKQQLIRSFSQGMAELPEERRVEGMRLAAKLMKATMSEAEAPDNKDSEDSEEDIKRKSVVHDNLNRAVTEAGLRTLDKDALEGFGQALRESVKPTKLVRSFSNLSEAERAEMTDVLIEAQIMPEDKRAQIEEMTRPGGQIDRFAWWDRVVSYIFKFSWLVFIPPAVELILAFGLAFATCHAPLVVWLAVDGVVGLAAAAGIFQVFYLLPPVYVKFQDDPEAFLNRWQGVWMTQEWSLSKEQHGILWVGCIRVFIGTLVTVCAILFTLIWLQIGIIMLLIALFKGCSSGTSVVVLLFILFRELPLVTGLLLIWFYQKDIKDWVSDNISIQRQETTSASQGYGSCAV